MAKTAYKHTKLLRSFAGYDELLETQDGHCALCPTRPKTRRLDIDHDHDTMQVRGLLCHRCNRVLQAWVTPAWLRRAANYLEKGAEDASPPV